MAHIHVPHEVPVRSLESSPTFNVVAGAMVLVGAIAFVIALASNPRMAWVSYVSNWLFFTSVAMGAVMFAAATTVVKARWNWSVRRISVAFAAFLPFAFVLLLPMLGLREDYFPWIAEMAHDPILQEKQAYLNIPFLVTRNVVGAIVLFGLGVYFAYLAVRPDIEAARTRVRADDGRTRWYDRFGSGWKGQEAEEVRSWRRMGKLAPVLALAYAAVMSMFVYDWAMSLEPHWFSTLFGGWFFMGAFWIGIAATALTAVLLRRAHPDFRVHIGLQQRHDLGKLSFAFCVFWAYLFWSQYIVIWYGKLPWEQAWMIRRAGEPWAFLSALTIVLCFVVPFAGLLGRAPKLKPGLLATFAGVILVGVWLERYMLVAPSLHHEGDPLFPWFHPLVALLFAGFLLGSVRWFLSTFPVLQVWQPPTAPEMLEMETVGSAGARRSTAGWRAS